MCGLPEYDLLFVERARFVETYHQLKSFVFMSMPPALVLLLALEVLLHVLHPLRTREGETKRPVVD